MQICELTDKSTKCTEHCRECAKDLYKDLKAMAGRAELVTEEAIVNDLGENALGMLRQYGFIEHCRVDELGRHWYAI
jgi:hypothetical protein